MYGSLAINAFAVSLSFNIPGITVDPKRMIILVPFLITRVGIFEFSLCISASSDATRFFCPELPAWAFRPAVSMTATMSENAFFIVATFLRNINKHHSMTLKETVTPPLPSALAKPVTSVTYPSFV